MSDDTWKAICQFALKDLKNRSEFSISHTVFERMFFLEDPYYQEMVSRARKQHPGFYFDSPYKTPTKEPSDHIWFRSEQ